MSAFSCYYYMIFFFHVFIFVEDCRLKPFCPAGSGDLLRELALLQVAS